MRNSRRGNGGQNERSRGYTPRKEERGRSHPRDISGRRRETLIIEKKRGGKNKISLGSSLK